jgi:hypothetical protein
MGKWRICCLLLFATWVSCKAGRESRRYSSITHPAYTAFDEDSLVSFQFVSLKDGRFFYTLGNRDSCGAAQLHHYYGKVRDTPDTLYLRYRKQQPPAGMPAYLVKEISGSYLIQTFTDSSRRVFMYVRHHIVH